MINNRMRTYDYYQLEGMNNYNQPMISEEVKGSIKMALYPTTNTILDNPLYKNVEYIGITHDTKVDDTYIIVNGKERLKVLYTNKNTHLNYVYLSRMV